MKLSLKLKLCFLLGIVVGVSAQPSSVRDIVSFPQEEISIHRWLKQADWEEQKGTADLFSIKDKTMFMQSEDSSTTIGTRFKKEIKLSEYPEIEFRYKVDKLPSGTNVTVKSRDDAAFRLFVLFDKGGILSVTPPHTIGYVWDTTLEKGATGRAATFGQVRYIVIGSGKEGLGEWHVCRRNLRDDYKMLFEKDKVPKIKAIGLKCDSNHSHSSSASAIQWIRLLPDR